MFMSLFTALPGTASFFLELSSGCLCRPRLTGLLGGIVIPTPYLPSGLEVPQLVVPSLNSALTSLVGRALPTGPPHPPRMRISLPRHDLLGEERWPISQRRRAKSLFLNGLLLGSICKGIQVKLINHCQAVRIKQ